MNTLVDLATELATRAIERRAQYRELQADGDSLHIAMDSVVLGHGDESLTHAWQQLVWHGDDHGQEMLGEIDYERLARARALGATLCWLLPELEAVEATYRNRA